MTSAAQHGGLGPLGLAGLIDAFRDAGYSFAPFAPEPGQHTIFLRHDIDFSLEAAVTSAVIEHALGVTATYFLMLTSNFYNLLSSAGQEQALRIAALGHTVSLHFDPTAHHDIDAGFGAEKRMFEELFDTPIEVVSLHRPQSFLNDNNRRLEGVRHTYEDCYFRDVKYLSDSGGRFHHGHPLESDAFATGAPVHLLLHPIWWVTDGDSPSEKLRHWQRERHDFLLDEIGRNCLSFDGHSALAGIHP